MSHDFQAIEASLRVRLRAIDSRSDAGNGTLLADAAATLIAADAVAARAADSRIAALADDDLEKAMTTVQILLAAEERAQAALPFGTKAISHEVGSASVAGQEYVLLAQHAGMMREELAPRQSDNLNLDHLLRLIERRSKRLACRSLGRPRPITDAGLIEEYSLRFEPCAEAGGVSLEVCLGIRPIAWTTHARLIGMAEDIVQAMRAFWKIRRMIAAQTVQRISEFAQAVVAAGPDAEGLRLAGVVARPFETLPGRFSMHLLVMSFDEALRPTVARWEAYSGETTPNMMRSMIRQHAEALDSIVRRDPVEMDELAAAIAEAAPEGTAAVLERLATDVATDVILPLPDSRSLVTRLHWVSGMIVAHIFPTQTVAHASNTFMVLDGDWPETIGDSFVGKGIDEVIDLPMNCPFPIRQVDRFGARRLQLRFQTETRPVDFETGTIGPVQSNGQPALAA